MEQPNDQGDGNQRDPHGLLRAAFLARRRPGRWTPSKALQRQRMFHNVYLQLMNERGGSDEIKCSWFGAEETQPRWTIKHCHRPLCPTCWHRRHAPIMDALDQLRAEVLYLRWTDPVWYRDEVPKKVMTAFKAKRQAKDKDSIRLVAWVVAPFNAQVDEDDPRQRQEQKRNLVWDRVGPVRERATTCWYRLVGVFVADREVPQQGRRRRGQRARKIDERPVKQDGKVVGTIFRHRVANVDELRRRWLEMNPHPAWFRRHQLMPDYDQALKQTFPKLSRLLIQANGLKSSKRQKGYRVENGRVIVNVSAQELRKRVQLKQTKIDVSWTKGLTLAPLGADGPDPAPPLAQG